LIHGKNCNAEKKERKKEMRKEKKREVGMREEYKSRWTSSSSSFLTLEERNIFWLDRLERNAFKQKNFVNSSSRNSNPYVMMVSNPLEECTSLRYDCEGKNFCWKRLI
jgi:hypothetical protein